MRAWLAIAALLLAAPVSAASWVVVAGSEVRVSAEHPFQTVRMRSFAPEGAFDWSPSRPLDFSGMIERPLSVAWASFDSGNANRDAVIRERVRAYRFPHVYFVPEDFRDAASTPTGLTATAIGRLYVGGKMQRFEAPFRIALEAADRLRLYGGFDLDMTAFEIVPPSLLFLPAEPLVTIELELVMRTAAVPTRE